MAAYGGMRDINPNDNLDAYNTYEEYLDAQVSPIDLYYLNDEELARQLVELGVRGTGETVKREDFEKSKSDENARASKVRSQPRNLSHKGLKDYLDYPLLVHLAEREAQVLSGKRTTIIFIRHKTETAEISGYIDFGHRLKTDKFRDYFELKRKLLPRPTDLSFYNWETQTCTSNPTPNFQVIADNENGLQFKNKRDRKIINVDPQADKPGDSTTRLVIDTHEYTQCVLYDHNTRRKS